MNKLLIITLLTLWSCDSQPLKSKIGDTKSPAASTLLTSINPSGSKAYALGTVIDLGYETAGEIDSVQFFVNNIRVQSQKFVPQSVGQHHLKVVAYLGVQQFSLNSQFTVLASSAPMIQKIKVVRKHPHDPQAYTQGLIFYDGKFIESTGERGRSSIREVAIATGKVLRKRDLEAKYFGEGVAQVGSKLYQLTWQEGTIFVYDRTNFANRTELPLTGEGWGVTSDKTNLYVSDGSHKITIYDPAKFQRLSTIQVADNKQLIEYINEMEWIDGKIWANIYTTNLVAVIDPLTGSVEKYIDCHELVTKIGNADSADVLNGIAHDPATGRIWMTGKDWDTLFEVAI